MTVSFRNCDVNNLSIKRPRSLVGRVLRCAAPLLPAGGTHCLVNINATSYLMRNMTHKISVFSYMCPAHITQGKVTVA